MNIADIDTEFMCTAASLNMTVLEASHRAETFAADVAVRRLAGQIVIGAMQIDSELRQLADEHGITLPEQLDDRNRAQLGWLYNLSGKDFDCSYVCRIGIEAQLEMMRLFEHELGHGSNEQVRESGARHLRDLRHYVEMARRLHFCS